MNASNLNDLRPKEATFKAAPANGGPEGKPGGMDNPAYHEEINTIKIDKLSNKVTIISVIIPVMIGAILVFAYLDMKERVVDVDHTKQVQVDQISRLVEEKLNALDVKIARNRFDIENRLPELAEKSLALEGRLTKMDTAKASVKAVKTEMAKLGERILNNARQDKTTLNMVERMNKEALAAIETSRREFDAAAAKIREEFALFKEEFDARLLELSDYEQQIGLLRKDLSLMDKKLKRLEQEQLTGKDMEEQIRKTTRARDDMKKELDARLARTAAQVSGLKKSMTARMDTLSRQVSDLSDRIKTTRSAPPAAAPAPVPDIQPASPTAPSGPIQQKPLNQ